MNKKLSIFSKLLGLAILGSASMLSTAHAAESVLTRKEQAEVMSVIESTSEVLEVQMDEMKRMLKEVASQASSSTGMLEQQEYGTRISRSKDFNIVRLVNPAGSSISSGTMTNGRSLILLKFASNSDNDVRSASIEGSVPMALRGKHIVLMLEHGNLTSPTTSLNISDRDITCFTDITALADRASFSGESVSDSRKFDTTKNIGDIKKLSSTLASCRQAEINSRNWNESDNNLIRTTKHVDYDIDPL